MGGPGGGGGGGGGKRRGPKPPQPPKLPDDKPGAKDEQKVPQALRDFVDCKGDSYELVAGKLTWLDLPGGAEPEVSFEKGEAAGTVNIKITIGFITLTLPTSVVGGKLTIDTTNLPGQIPKLGNAKKSVEDWVKKLNDWLAHNKKQVGEITFDEKTGKARITKVVQVGMVVPPGGGGDGEYAQKPGWGKKALVAVGTTVAVTAAGVGTYAIVSDGDENPPAVIDGTDQPTDEPTGEPTDEPTGEPTDEPTGEPTDEPTDEPTSPPEGPPPTQEELEQALITRQGLPPGYQETQLPPDTGEGKEAGLCNGPGEANLAPVSAKAMRGFFNAQAGRFTGEVIFAYSSVAFGMQAFEAIRSQGASCTTYEDATADGTVFTVMHEEVPTSPKPGWDDALLYHEVVTFETSAGPRSTHRYIAFERYEGTVLAFNATAPTQAGARNLLNTVFPRVVDKALSVLD